MLPSFYRNMYITYITLTLCPRRGGWWRHLRYSSEMPSVLPKYIHNSHALSPMGCWRHFRNSSEIPSSYQSKEVHAHIHSFIHTQQLTPCPRWGVGGISVIPPKFPRFTKVTKYMHTYVRSFIHTYIHNKQSRLYPARWGVGGISEIPPRCPRFTKVHT
jgi:hypothetical protein